MTAHEETRINEMKVRLDAAAVLASQAILGEVDQKAALEGLLGMIENCRLQLKAIGK